MIISEDVIILLTRRYGDSSTIFHSFGRKYGKLSFLAKGVLRPKSKLSGVIQALNFVNLSFRMKEGKDLLTLASADLLDYHKNIRADLDKTALAITICQLVDYCTQAHYVNSEIFDLLKNSLKQINEANDDYYHLVKFTMGLTKCLGFEIDFTSAAKENDIVKFYPTSSTFWKSSAHYNEKLLKISRETMTILQNIQSGKCTESDKKNKPRLLSIVKFYQSYLGIHLDKKIKLRSLELLI